MKGRTGIKHPRARQVVQSTLNGAFVAEFPSIAEAALFTKVHHIGDACRANRAAGGFLWKFKDKDIVRSSEKSENVLYNLAHNKTRGRVVRIDYNNMNRKATIVILVAYSPDGKCCDETWYNSAIRGFDSKRIRVTHLDEIP